MRKRILSLLLAVAMVVTLLPVTAWAEEVPPVQDSGSTPAIGESVATGSNASKPDATENTLSVSADNVADSGAELTFTGSADGTVYYLVQKSDETAPDEAAVLAGETVAVTTDSAITAELTGLTTETDYTAYALLESNDGSRSAIASAQFTTEAAAAPVLRSASILATDISYMDENGAEQTKPAAEVTEITDTTMNLRSSASGWYVVNSDVNLARTLGMSGDVHLILADGGSLTVDGLQSPGTSSLTIYGQSGGSGKLIATRYGITGSEFTVTINGGVITSTSIGYIAAIGGIQGSSLILNTTVTINGGTVNATSNWGAGIGGGADNITAATVTINGGTVTAESHTRGAGIGGGNGGGATVTINGGTVTAKGSEGAGIGNGCGTSKISTVAINGGTIDAVSASGAGIGGGNNGSGLDTAYVTISGGSVTASGGSGTDIGGGDGTTITITGGTVSAPALSVPPTGSGGRPVPATQIKLAGVSAVTPVTSLTISGTPTALTNVSTDASGGFALWIAGDVMIKSVVAGGTVYSGSIPAGGTGTLIPSNASPSAMMKPFVKAVPRDVSVTISGNGALTAISNGPVPLTRNTDYTISGDTLTFKQEYLQTLAVGEVRFTLDCGFGSSNPVFTITIYNENPAELIAIGDSIASGYGLTGYTPPMQMCQPLNSGAYAEVAGRALNLTTGDFTMDGISSSGLNSMLNFPSSAEMFAEYFSYTEVITLSIGSNDVLEPFLAVIAAKLRCNANEIPEKLRDLQRDPTEWSSFLAALNVDDGTELKDNAFIASGASDAAVNISSIISFIRQAAPNARLYVTNAYNPYLGIRLPYGTGTDYLDLGAIADNYIKTLNTAFSNNSADYTLIDTYSAFTAAMAGGASPVNVNPLTMNLDPHPNAAGHALIADLIVSDYNGDTTAPAVVSVAPNGTDAAIGGDIVITFSEAMNTSAGTVSFDGGATSLTGGSWTVGNTVYTVPYALLGYSTAYTVSISGFEDTAGNTMTADASHSFTTMTEPLTPSVSVNTLTVSKGGTANFTVSLGQGAAAATAADITVTNGSIASVSTGRVTASGAITVTGLATGSTSVTVAFNDSAQTVKSIAVTVSPASNGGNPSSGDSDSSSSSGSSLVTSEKQPDYPVTAEISVHATADKNGHASATIPENAIADAIKKAAAAAKSQGKTEKGIGILVTVNVPANTKSLGLVLSQSVLRQLADAKVQQFEVNGQLLTLNLDQEAIRQLLSQSTGDITVAVKPVTAAGVRTAYEITFSYVKDGKTVTITSLGDGSANLSIPCTPAKTESAGYLYAVYVDAKGKHNRISGSAYNANSRSMIFSTDHFSIYGVGYEAPSAKFTDIGSHWAKESIDYVVGRRLVSGTSNTTFSPDTAMTRGMLVTALGRLAGVDVKAYTTNSFTDVKTDSAFRSYIEWAYKKGIIQGTGNSKFEPDRSVTREEIAVIFANFAKTTGYKLPVTRTATAYADASSIGSTYKDAVTAMQQAGIMMGEANNKFNPKANATRAEVSAMLHRYIKLTIDPATAQGWAKNDDGQFLYYKNGKPITGTQTIDNVKYFFNMDGTLKTGWVKDGSSWRFYSGNILLVGFWNLGANGESKTYYFTADGLMVSGKWLQIEGKWYYFYVDGKLAKSTTVDGYEVDANGVRKTK